MGSELSRELDTSSHHSSNQVDSIDVATYEAEMSKMREINRMDQAIRSRLQNGVKYNMKIVVCGDKGTGKTVLWKRFQGQAFEAEYNPTPEIQSATIDWTSPSADGSTGTPLCSIHREDVVKVDVWDVVDKAIHTDRNAVNRLSTADLVYNSNLTSGEPGSVSEGKHTLKLLDSSVVDIYKDAHAVVFMINPHSASSLGYVRDKYPHVPEHVSILLVLNFRDKVCNSRTQTPPHSQIASPAAAPSAAAPSSSAPSAAAPSPSSAPTVNLQQVRDLAQEIRSYRSNQLNDDVNVIETSLLDCYGLLHLHHYLDVPFLRLKQKSLQEQLALVERDLHSCHAHLTDTVRLSNYEDYLRKFEARKRERQLQQQQSSHGDELPVPPAHPGPITDATATSTTSAAMPAGTASSSSASASRAAGKASSETPTAASAFTSSDVSSGTSNSASSNDARSADTTAATGQPSPQNSSLHNNLSSDASNSGSGGGATSALDSDSTRSTARTTSPMNTVTTSTAFGTSIPSRSATVPAGRHQQFSPSGSSTPGRDQQSLLSAVQDQELEQELAAALDEVLGGPRAGTDRTTASAVGGDLGRTGSVGSAGGALQGLEAFLQQREEQGQEVEVEHAQEHVATASSAPAAREAREELQKQELQRREEHSHTGSTAASKSPTAITAATSHASSVAYAVAVGRKVTQASTLPDDSGDSSDEGVGNSKLAQKVGFGGKSLSSVRENMQRGGGLMRPLRKAKSSTAKAANGSSPVAEDRSPVDVENGNLTIEDTSVAQSDL